MFTHLHVHTEYSLLDGALRISDLVSRAREHGFNSVAVTDHGVMYGCVEFYRQARAAGIKPIIGCEVYMCPDRFAKTYQTKEYSHLILLCENNVGYQNLIKLVSLAYMEGFYYKPRIDYKLLAEYSEGLIALSACLAGDIPSLILAGDLDKAKALALELTQMFKGNFYLELQENSIPEQKEVNKALIEMSKELDIPLVATNDVHYLNREDSLSQDILMCVQTGHFLDEENRMKFNTTDLYFKSEEEMMKDFAEIPEAVTNTQIVADKCNVELDFNSIHLPSFNPPMGYTNFDYLKYLCEQGLTKRYATVTDKLLERLHFELQVINNMGFTDYFLIVHDFVDFAKRNDIAVGPGRGSAAGSLCAYVLRITDIDPIEYNLLFERFLNPERISMPDIDIDFCMERRDEVIKYVVDKYGSDRVSQIITFGTLGAKQVIRDVARVLRVSPGEADRISKMIPFAIKMTIERALNENPKFNIEYETNETVKKIIDIGRKLEGLPRHASVHAAGIVISKKPVYEYVPLQVSTKDNSVMTQYPMGDLEQLGLLKMDFLGLRNLTVIQHTIKMIKEDLNLDIDLSGIKFDDKKVFALIASGDTDGIFQLESPGMRSLMTQLVPQNLDDIMVGISLFRPGPMDSIPAFIAQRSDTSKIKYLHPRLEPILKDTFGAIVYQEQVMEIVRDLAGYSLGRSDLVRRAMSKKKSGVMLAEREIFVNGETDADGKIIVEGAVRRGVPKHIAEEIFSQMIDFAAYAFNKSHACAYGAIAYYTAYLKCYYPLQFITALINSYMSFTEKISAYIQYVRKLNIKVLPPDINKSRALFCVENDSIRFGILAVRDVGEKAVSEIINERNAHGDYKSFFDFADRCAKHLNKRMLEGLIISGCFDCFSQTRSQLSAVSEQVLKRAHDKNKLATTGQISLFDMGVDMGYSDEISLTHIPEYNYKQLLAMEKHATGAYLSGHPLNEIRDKIESYDVNTLRIAQASTSHEEQAYFEGRVIELCGIITNIHKRTTRQKKLMARCTFEDLYGSVEVLIFPAVLSAFEEYLINDSIVLMRGKADISEDETQFILESIEPYSPLDEKFANKTLYVKIPASNEQGFSGLRELVKNYRGVSSFVVYIESTGRKFKAEGNMSVKYSDELFNSLVAQYGEENIILK